MIDLSEPRVRRLGQAMLRALASRCMAGVVLFALQGAAPALAASLKPLPVDAVILAFGDSLTYGTGSPEMDYPRMLEVKIDRRVVNSGDPGETTGHGRRRLPAMLAEIRPALLILCLGLNDFLLGVPAQTTRDNLGAMIEAAQGQGVQVVLLAVPRLRPGMVPEPLYAELGRRYGVPVANELLPAVLRKSLMKTDGVHPNREGYQSIANGLARVLREEGALR
jgi:acyl-CoA thioesterase-1